MKKLYAVSAILIFILLAGSLAYPVYNISRADELIEQSGEELAGIYFGPVDAVEDVVDDLDKEANEHWHGVWDNYECEWDPDEEPDCEDGDPEFPQMVVDYWLDNPDAAPEDPYDESSDQEEATQAREDVDSHDTVWEYEADAAVTASPVMINGVTITASRDGVLHAVDEEGKKIDTLDIGTPVTSSPVVGPDDRVYVGSFNGKVYALDTDGEEFTQDWTFETDGMITSSPAVDSDGIVYVGSTDGSLYAIDGENGDELWEYETDGRITSSPAIDGQNVYFGSWDNHLYAISAGEDGGEYQWSFSAEGEIKSSPAFADIDELVFGCEEGYAYAVEPLNGELIADKQVGGALTSSFVFGEGAAYVGSWDGNLYALEKDDDDNIEVKWSFETGEQITATPTVDSEENVYVGSADGNLYGVNSEGEALGKIETGRAIASSLNISDTLGAFGSGDGNLYGIETAAPGLQEQNSLWPKFGRDTRNTGQIEYEVAPVELNWQTIEEDTMSLSIDVDTGAEETINWIVYNADGTDYTIYENTNTIDHDFEGEADTKDFTVQINQPEAVISLEWSDNSLTADIPSELGFLENLQRIWLDGNEFYGEIPGTLGNLAELEELDLGLNELSGEIPGELGDLMNLQQLGLWGNDLSGYEDGAFAGFTTALEEGDTPQIDVSSNQLEQEDIDNMLADLRIAADNENIENIGVDLTDNAAPSAAGEDDADWLEAERGWTVNHDE